MFNFNFLRECSGNSFSIRFCIWFFSKKIFLCYILLTNQMSLSDRLFLRYWARFNPNPNRNQGAILLRGNCPDTIGQYVYCNCLFLRLWRQKFLIKPLLYVTKTSRQFKYLENEKSFEGEIRSIFHDFVKSLSCQNLPQTGEYAFRC